MRNHVLALGLLTACSSSGGDTTPDATNPCVNETRADTFVVGLDKPGVAGLLDFKLMSASPAPPARGDNTWIVEVSSMTSGVVGGPVSGAAMLVTPFMPDHGHGTPITVNVTSMPTAGQYQLTPVNLWMPGYWETTVQATSPSSVHLTRRLQVLHSRLISSSTCRAGSTP